jgi:4'-phosphopantetheinyl transferase
LLRGFALRHHGRQASNAELKFQRTERGKPVVAGGLGIDYNVSHAGDWVVLAGGPGHHVGVDVMRTRDSRVDRLPEFFRLMQRQFTAAEWVAIKGPEGARTEAEQLEAFFRHWTLKESYVKAVGTGLNIDLQTLDFRLGRVEVTGVETGTRLVRDGRTTEWSFEESRLDSEHAVCVCSEASEEEEARPFTVLSVPEVLAMFDHSGPPLRPASPPDFSLYDGKARMKPF